MVQAPGDYPVYWVLLGIKDKKKLYLFKFIGKKNKNFK